MLEKKKIFETLGKLGLVAKDEEGEEGVDMDDQAVPVKSMVAFEAVQETRTAVPEASIPVPAQAQPERPQTTATDSVIEKKLDTLIESYEKNKLLSIEDIYRKFGLETDTKRTIFMADIYMKALPENLPTDIKRDSVHNIMQASDIKIDELLNDAYKRIDSLNNVLEGVVATTEEMRAKNLSSVKELEKRIEELKRAIVERDKFQDTQNTTIEYEIQRVINIVDFVKPKK